MTGFSKRRPALKQGYIEIVVCGLLGQEWRSSPSPLVTVDEVMELHKIDMISTLYSGTIISSAAKLAGLLPEWQAV